MMLAANAASIISGTLSSPIIASRVMAMKAMYEPIMYTLAVGEVDHADDAVDHGGQPIAISA